MSGPTFVYYLKQNVPYSRCGVCDQGGFWRVCDRTLLRAVCLGCFDHVASADRELAAAMIERPEKELAEENPK